MSSDLLTTLKNGVRVIRINRPESKNALNLDLYEGISEILNTDAENDSVVVTILTGVGDFYCSGFDIKNAVSQYGQEGATEKNNYYINKLFTAFITYPKILVALINGPAIGMAVTTAALCDIVYASDRATFQTPFVKLGVCAEGCSSYTIPRVLGRSRASELLLLGKKFTAKEMYDAGFVARIIPHENLESFLEELKQHGSLPVHSVKVTKNLILHPLKQTLLDCNKEEIKQLQKCYTSEEFVQAIIAFMSRKSKL